jgi:hypothetical protein
VDDDGVTYLTDMKGSGPYDGRWQPVANFWLCRITGAVGRAVTPSVIRLKMVKHPPPLHGKRRSGHGDWMGVPDIEALTQIEGVRGPGPTLTVYDVKLNMAEGPTADANLRRLYAVDYDAMAAIWSGQGVLLNGPPPVLSFRRPVYRQDLDKREALAASAIRWHGAGICLWWASGERRLGWCRFHCRSGIDVTITAIPWSDAVATFADPPPARYVPAVR